jgi:hypothetical protein
MVLRYAMLAALCTAAAGAACDLSGDWVALTRVGSGGAIPASTAETIQVAQVHSRGNRRAAKFIYLESTWLGNERTIDCRGLRPIAGSRWLVRGHVRQGCARRRVGAAESQSRAQVFPRVGACARATTTGGLRHRGEVQRYVRQGSPGREVPRWTGILLLRDLPRHIRVSDQRGSECVRLQSTAAGARYPHARHRAAVLQHRALGLWGAIQQQLRGHRATRHLEEDQPGGRRRSPRLLLPFRRWLHQGHQHGGPRPVLLPLVPEGIRGGANRAGWDISLHFALSQVECS